MSGIIREFEFDINFNEDKFKRTDGSTEIITIVENDNKSTKFKFNFEEEIADGTNVLVKIKHNTGFVKEYILNVVNKKAELTLTNSILVAGTLKMTISYIGSNNEILTPTQYQNKILVKESITGETTIPEEDENLLEGLISQVNLLNQETTEASQGAEQATENANNAAQAARGAKNEIENTFEQIQKAYEQQVDTDASLELAAARTNDKGITFSSLKERLDNIDNTRGRIDGVRYYFGQSSTKMERLYDSIGMIANATHDGSEVENDFDNVDGYRQIITRKRDKTTKRILATIGDSDYDSIEGEVMTDYPESYWRFEADPEGKYVDILKSSVKRSGFNTYDAFSLGRYPLSFGTDGKLQTRSGAIPAYNKNIVQYRNLVNTEYGNNACLMDWRYCILLLMYLVEYADTHSQSTLGQGHSSFRYSDADKALMEENSTNRIIVSSTVANYFVVGQIISIGNNTAGNFGVAESRKITSIVDFSNGAITGKAITFSGNAVNITTSSVIWSSAQLTGGCDSLGMKSGCIANDGKHAVCYRGYEKNSIFDFVDSINIKNCIAFLCMDPTKYTSDVFEGDYKQLGYVNSTKEGYIKKLGFDPNYPFLMLPTEVGGGSSTYIPDYYWCSATGNRVVRVGGFPHYGAGCGLFCWNLNSASSYSSWGCGARVLFYQL